MEEFTEVYFFSMHISSHQASSQPHFGKSIQWRGIRKRRSWYGPCSRSSSHAICPSFSKQVLSSTAFFVFLQGLLVNLMDQAGWQLTLA